MPALRIAIVFVLVIVFQRSGALAASCPAVRIPAVFSAGRALATPIAAADHHMLRFWIDSDGSGFIFDDVAVRYATSKPLGESTMRRATLPHWSARATIPALTRPAIEAGSTESVTRGGSLPILARSDVAGDPIFNDLDGQLGASWLQNRIWIFDYARGTLSLRCDGTDPPHSKAEEVQLSYAVDTAGKLVGGLHYPHLTTIVGGQTYPTTLDTAATVVLSRGGLKRMRDLLPAVRATSFAKRSVVARWHVEHPDWRFDGDAGAAPGVAAILVPSITTSRVRFQNVWFTTRPGDDVFEGDDVDLKLGPSAFGRSVMTVDYVHNIAIIQAAHAPVTPRPK